MPLILKEITAGLHGWIGPEICLNRTQMGHIFSTSALLQPNTSATFAKTLSLCVGYGNIAPISILDNSRGYFSLVTGRALHGCKSMFKISALEPALGRNLLSFFFGCGHVVIEAD